jgi:leucyl-tRNA---protein transferase
MTYLNWDTQHLTDHKPSTIEHMYEYGYVATRVDKGVMNRTRSVRVSLAEYAASSENRRILRKVENLVLTAHPLPYADYHWSIHKLAKDFYTTKFGEDTFSANKIKELITEPEKSTFNTLLVYTIDGKAVAYCIALLTEKILHYSYPFYDQDSKIPSLGLGMMTKAVEWAKEKDLSHVYLGSLQRPTDTYKLQFTGLEWFDGTAWQKDLEPLKAILK